MTIIYQSRLDATIQALAIASSYAQQPVQLPPGEVEEPTVGKTNLTLCDIAWAWAQYSNEECPTSLKQLSKALNCRKGTLQELLRDAFGYEYKCCSLRRATGGDLFRKFRRLRAIA